MTEQHHDGPLHDDHHWQQGVRVIPMDWDELSRWSVRLRKLTHDVNNALVPAFAYADLLLLKIRAQQPPSQFDDLPQQLEHTRQTMQHATDWVVQPAASYEPTWREIQLDLTLRARQANMAFRWIDPERNAALSTWPRQNAHHVLSALVRNSCDALTDVEDGEITLSVFTTSDSIYFEVRDSGRGCGDTLSASRGLLARHGHGHLGLGLPSAAAVARASSAELRIVSPKEGGFVAMIQVPREQGQT